jgi:glycosyltransferase involved in cell wall biosynthesis
MVNQKELPNLAIVGGSVMKKKILLKAPLLTRSGYGEQSRFALRSLRSREDLFDIFIQPLTWGETSWIHEETEERRWIDETIEKTIHHIHSAGTFDISLQVSIPNEWQSLAPINIGYTAGIETTRVAHEWIQLGEQMDSIIVVSNHSKNIYKNTIYEVVNDETGEKGELQLGKEVTAVNYPVKNFENLQPLGLDLEYDFNFVCVAQMGPRKNLLNTVKWFVEEFHDESVGLIIKSNIAKNCTMDRELLRAQLLAPLTSEFPDRKCKIYILHGDMTDEEMHAIYLNDKVKAALSLTHGEGFGLPLFEAAYMGTPVIAPGWSGQCDFLFDDEIKERFYNVAFDISKIPEEIVWDGVLIKESGWCYPREQSAKENMRLCYNDINAINSNSNTADSIASHACTHAEFLHEKFSEEKMHAQFIEAMNLNLGDFDVEQWIDNLDIEEIE